MRSAKQHSGPRVFDPDHVRLIVEEASDDPGPEAATNDETMQRKREARIQRGVQLGRRMGWGAVFLSAVSALLVMATGLWASNLVADLMVREGWLGWLAFGAFVIASFAALMLAAREVYGLLRLRKLSRIRSNAEAALRQGAESQARGVLRNLIRLYSGRDDTEIAVRHLRQYAGGIHSAEELLRLADRELGEALDPQARANVAQSARRVSVLTALSPGAVLDMIFVAAETLAMMRRLSQLYGGRPGFFGLLRLARRVISHIIITGGLAFTLDLAQDVFGKRIAGVVAGRLGEGFFNGALTARLGLAAINVCRPLPFLDAKPPNLRAIIGELASRGHSESKSQSDSDKNRF